MKKKNIFGITVAALISAAMLAGCLKVTTDTATTDTEAAPAAEDIQPEEEKEDVQETASAGEAGEAEEEAQEVKEPEPEEEAVEEESAEGPEEAADDQDTSEEEAVGGLIGCTVYDNSKKEVSLAKIVSQNKVTMLNFWGTFCGPCIQEMPDLADIERDYKDKGFEIVGITVDAVDYYTGKLDAHVIRDAEDIMKDTNVEYPVVYAGSDILEYAEISVVPTTFFVDAKGNIIAGPIPGSNSRSGWEKVINKLLK